MNLIGSTILVRSNGHTIDTLRCESEEDLAFILGDIAAEWGALLGHVKRCWEKFSAHDDSRTRNNLLRARKNLGVFLDRRYAQLVKETGHSYIEHFYSLRDIVDAFPVMFNDVGCIQFAFEQGGPECL